MKNTKLHLTRIPALVAVFAAAACDDGTSTNATGSSTTSSSDATSTSGSSTGSSATGGAGGMGGAGPSTTVTVHTETIGGQLAPVAVANVEVFTSDASGKLGDGPRRSDANGTVVVTVPFGGSITVASEFSPTQRSIATYYDLGAATEVHLKSSGEQPQSPPDNTPMPNMVVLATNQPAATANVVVTASCLYPPVTVPATFPSTSVNISNFKGCPGKDAYDVIVRSVDASGQTLASAMNKDLVFTPGASTTNNLTMSTANIGMATVDLHGAPATTGYDVTLWGFSRYVDGRGFSINDVLAKLQPGQPSDAFSASVAFPLDKYDAPAFYAAIYFADGRAQYTVRSALGTAPTVTADMSTLARVFPTLDVTEATHPTMSWTSVGSSTPSYVFGSVRFFDLNNVSPFTWDWYGRPVSAPGSMRMPDLPAENAPWLDVAATPKVIAVAGTIDRADLDGYDAFLGKPFDQTGSVTSTLSDSIEAMLPTN